MDDYKYLKLIEAIDPKNTFLEYIADRVRSDNYRGYAFSQHNRLTYDYFSSILQTIYEIAGNEKFDIHVGDDHGERQENAVKYYDIVKGIKISSGKGTVNSVKKNSFPDLARMGFLNRYDANENLITEGVGRHPVFRVALSGIGLRFATATTSFEKLKLFTDGVDTLTANAATELVELLHNNAFGIEHIDILEYMYILSDSRKIITYNDKSRYLLEYRRLNTVQKEQLDEYLKLYCNPSNRRLYGNKTLLRDYSNWKNASQQLFGLLSVSTYFKTNADKTRLALNTGDMGLFDENTKRGTKAKADYFRLHQIERNSGFELHHIVPFKFASNKREAMFIDDYKNLIYLSESKHLEFTKHGNKHVRMRYSNSNPNILFVDFAENFIIVKLQEDALFSPSQLQVAKDYNTTLIERFYLGTR